LSSTRARNHRLYRFVILRWAKARDVKKARDVNLHGLDHLEHFAQRMPPDARAEARKTAERI
jgi:hypothetical protein